MKITAGDNVRFSNVDDNPAIQTVKPEIEAVMVVAVSSLFNAVLNLWVIKP